MKNKKTEEKPEIPAEETSRAMSEPTPPVQIVQTVQLSDDSISRLADAVADRVNKRMWTPLLILARIAAADTLHTCQKPPAIFRHAVEEAAIARDEIKKAFQQATAN